MNDLTILITVTLLLSTIAMYFIFREGITVAGYEKYELFKPYRRAMLLINSFAVPFLTIVFIEAIVGLI